MSCAKLWGAALLVLLLLSNTALAAGSKPKADADKLDAIVEKNQEQAADQALESLTEQAQEEQKIKIGGSLS